MLITSVWQILDKREPDSKASATPSLEEFESALNAASAKESSPEKAKERPNEGTGSVGPTLPAEISPPLAGPGCRGEFMRALEEVKKEVRSPLLDVFE